MNPERYMLNRSTPRETNTVPKVDVITTAADLLADRPGQNTEYDSAILQMTAGLLGMSTEDEELDALEIVLRAIK